MKVYALIILLLTLFTAGSCSLPSIKGDVVGKWQDQLTIRRDDDTVVMTTVTNAKDVRVLDTVVVKKKKATVEDRLLDDESCSPHFGNP